MAWSIMRRATDEDLERLEKRAVAFATRHNISLEDAEIMKASAVSMVEMELDFMKENEDLDCPYLNRLWLRIVGRALGAGAEGIAWGYVGFAVE